MTVVWLLRASVSPMPTKPPVLLVELVVALVFRLVFTVTLPSVETADKLRPTSIRSALMYADTLELKLMSASLVRTPTKPAPEPRELADDRPSPDDGADRLSDTPPGPRMEWPVIPVTVLGRSMRKVWSPTPEPKSTTALKRCCTPVLKPVVDRPSTAPALLSRNWNSLASINSTK